MTEASSIPAEGSSTPASIEEKECLLKRKGGGGHGSASGSSGKGSSGDSDGSTKGSGHGGTTSGGNHLQASFIAAVAMPVVLAFPP